MNKNNLVAINGMGNRQCGDGISFPEILGPVSPDIVSSSSGFLSVQHQHGIIGIQVSQFSGVVGVVSGDPAVGKGLGILLGKYRERSK